MLLDLILTLFGFLLVPVIVVMGTKKYPKAKLKKIAIINGVVVWLLFSIIIINAGGTGAGASGILWSFVGYWLMKKKCLEEVEETEENQTEDIDK